jgi:hypothetical protein
VQLKIDGVDVSAWTNAIDFDPSESDLGNQIGVMRAVLQDKTGGSCPKVPAWGLSADLLDDDLVTSLFGGRVFSVVEKTRPIKRRWQVAFQDHNARLFETATGSLNKTGVVDSDRNFVIAIMRDALKNQSFGRGTGIDDPIITANEPNWPGVKATMFLTGLDWSYMPPKTAFDNLAKYAPGNYLRIRPDKILEYAPLGDTLAPFALHSAPDGVDLVGVENWEETEELAGHRNKLRRGGAGGSEVTAFDEVSYARIGRILEDPYKNDTGIPASELERRTYAELKTMAIRRLGRGRVYVKGAKAGQAIDVVNTRIGTLNDFGQYPEVFSLAAPSKTAKLDEGYRGRFLIQKVATEPLGNGKFAYALELGSYQPDLATALAILAARTEA